MKYRKGDIVKVKLELEVGTYNQVSFTNRMKIFRGLEARVIYTKIDNLSGGIEYFHLQFKNQEIDYFQKIAYGTLYSFTEDMVEPYGFVKSNSII